MSSSSIPRANARAFATLARISSGVARVLLLSKEFSVVISVPGNARRSFAIPASVTAVYERSSARSPLRRSDGPTRRR